MTRTNLGILLGLALAMIVATQFEGALRGGILGGYLLGGCVGLVSVTWQRHALRTDVGKALSATLQAFLMKMVVALLAGLTLRYIEPAGRVMDWQAFLLAYTGAAMIAIFFSAFETSRSLKESML